LKAFLIEEKKKKKKKKERKEKKKRLSIQDRFIISFGRIVLCLSIVDYRKIKIYMHTMQSYNQETKRKTSNYFKNAH
jgi:hypothetical protein